MEMVDRLLLWLLAQYTPEGSLWVIKLEALLWSVIDVFLVFGVLKIFGLVRARKGRQRPMIIRYLLLWGSAVLTAWLPFTKTFFVFGALDCVIISLHLGILLYTFLAEGTQAFHLVRAVVRHAQRRARLESGRALSG